MTATRHKPSPNREGFFMLTTPQDACRVINMNIDGIEIPTHMINMITDHMTALIKGGMPADVETLHHAVRLANADAQSIYTQMLAGNANHNPETIRNAIAADVYNNLRKEVAA